MTHGQISDLVKGLNKRNDKNRPKKSGGTQDFINTIQEGKALLFRQKTYCKTQKEAEPEKKESN
jgi:hypothetical protein